MMRDAPLLEPFHLKKDCYERYTRILLLIPSDCIAKYKESWLDNIFLLLEKRYEDPEIISAMVEDIYWLY